MTVRLAVVQMKMAPDRVFSVERACSFAEEAAAGGAQVILLPELFEGLYFPQQQREEDFDRAHSVEGHPFLGKLADLARRWSVVLPVSFFERAGQACFNSLAMVDRDGTVMGIYRKSHVPDGPGYQEKFFFNPGDTGFRAWKTGHGAIGAGICWDQWFPESARCMALQGADLLLYPTAIGSEPPEAASLDSRDMWRRVQVGHAVANSCWLAAANRVGMEEACTFYGSSFICDFRGEIVAEADRISETIIYADIDLDAARRFRAAMGFFRDRRPDLYGPLMSLDGRPR